jgi:CHRD domain
VLVKYFPLLLLTSESLFYTYADHGVIGLNGQKVVPPSATSALGQGRLNLASLQNELLFDISVTEFTSTDSSSDLQASLHMGLPSVSGPEITPLQFTTSVSSVSAVVSLSGAQIISSEHIPHILAGQTYVCVLVCVCTCVCVCV